MPTTPAFLRARSPANKTASPLFCQHRRPPHARTPPCHSDGGVQIGWLCELTARSHDRAWVPALPSTDPVESCLLGTLRLCCAITDSKRNQPAIKRDMPHVCCESIARAMRRARPMQPHRAGYFGPVSDRPVTPGGGVDFRIGAPTEAALVAARLTSAA